MGARVPAQWQDRLAPQRELGDGPRRHLDLFLPGVAQPMPDHETLAVESYRDLLGQPRPVGRTRYGHRPGCLGDVTRLVVGGIGHRRDLGRCPETMAAVEVEDPRVGMFDHGFGTEHGEHLGPVLPSQAGQPGPEPGGHGHPVTAELRLDGVFVQLALSPLTTR